MLISTLSHFSNFTAMQTCTNTYKLNKEQHNNFMLYLGLVGSAEGDQEG